MADAKKVRDEEHAEYLKDKKDDEDASRTVKQATDVLTNFYEENGLMLVQQPGPAGEAPPPPPKTWEDPNYGGKTMESNGIIEILKMVKEDIDRDISKADGAEEKAKNLYEKTKGENEDEVGA